VLSYELIIVCLVIGGVVTPDDGRLKKMVVELTAIPGAERETSWLVRDSSLKEFGLLLPHQSIDKTREATMNRKC